MGPRGVPHFSCLSGTDSLRRSNACEIVTQSVERHVEAVGQGGRIRQCASHVVRDRYSVAIDELVV